MAIIMATLCSCSKEEELTGNDNNVEKEGLLVTVSFTGDHEHSLKSSINTVPAEEWEKELKRITIFIFKEDGTCISQYLFNAAELAARTATFRLTSVSHGELVTFHAVANLEMFSYVRNLSEFEKLKHLTITDYNHYRYEVLSTLCIRRDGFLMTGQAEKIMAVGQKTSVAISLKRLVAKIRVKINVTEEFHSRYKGSIKIWGTDVMNSSKETWIVEKEVPPVGRVEYIYQDYWTVAPDSHVQLFYIFENGKRTPGDGVKLRIKATYSEAGLVVNAVSQTYLVELDLDPLGEGIVRRNCCYDVEVNINDLINKNLQYQVSAAKWEMPFDNLIQ